MTDSILENKWIPWHPKKIFLKNTKKNKQVLCFFDKFKEEDFFKDLKDEKPCVENQNKSELKEDLTKTEAYKIGFKKGLLESKEEYCALEKKLKHLFLDFENGLCMFEDALYSQLLKTVLKISSYVIGKKIDIDESILLKHVKKIIEKDGIFLKKPQLIVHPDNKILIEKILKDLLNTYKWKLVYDDNVDINSCKVKSESGDIDTTVNARWQELCRFVCSEEEY